MINLNPSQFLIYRFTGLHMVEKLIFCLNLIKSIYKVLISSKLTHKVSKFKGLLKIRMKMEENYISISQPQC